MAIKVHKIKGREVLSRALNKMAPEAEKAATEEKIKVVREAAAAIAARAPVGPSVDALTGQTRNAGSYKESIRGGFQSENTGAGRSKNTRASKDPTAVGVYANYIWRFLEFGTSPHVNKGAVPGSQHPGTAAQKHVFTTWREMRPKAKRKINAALYKSIKKTVGK